MDGEQYVVVARRYRPQTFEDLIGQEHVSRALAGAIASDRVGHAYLFTGARGVGKTSAARILAKALNCEQGPTETPCNVCDLCQAVSAGSDVDVLEIDGASNRGIDEIRQLRQNVGIRPSRARFKIYIIDEVHMLTREAFNALLKTLEEPPEHVKFIFCTTEPEKVPVTVLSRCQRFDFAGIQSASIVARLRQIVEAEGWQAEPEALDILARRAAGSMRDSQSLLEQLFAFGSETITVADVHRMLGTAGSERLGELIAAMAARDAAQALAVFDVAVYDGVDVGQLTEQLAGAFRDVMVAGIGCPDDLLLNTSPSDIPGIREAAARFGLETILAALQILDHTLSRLRVSTHRRTLAELAIVRIAGLGNLEALSGLVRDLASAATPATPPGSSSAAPAVKKKPEEGERLTSRPSAAPASIGATSQRSETPAVATISLASSPEGTSHDPAARQTASPEGKPTEPPRDTHRADDVAEPLSDEAALRYWQAAIAELGPMASAAAAKAQAVTPRGANHLVVQFAAKYSVSKSLCEQPDPLQQIVAALSAAAGRSLGVAFETVETTDGEAETSPAPAEASPLERLRHAAENPLVRRAGELFGAVLDRVEDVKK